MLCNYCATKGVRSRTAEQIIPHSRRTETSYVHKFVHIYVYIYIQIINYSRQTEIFLGIPWTRNPQQKNSHLFCKNRNTHTSRMDPQEFSREMLLIDPAAPSRICFFLGVHMRIMWLQFWFLKGKLLLDPAAPSIISFWGVRVFFFAIFFLYANVFAILFL